ncbi:iron-containing alcohol dehydrogenase [Cohnella cellulosilytica]|uniref:Iron-containing alcohol dehydrogenase n=1 Tax=Cohnella cellulosilytica TaxID=986710 RepID=A0ABW2F6D0_9BACL
MNEGTRLFQYDLPTAIEFGNGAVRGLPGHIGRLGGGKALVVTDPGVLKAGVADKVTAELERGGVEYELFSDVESDPDIQSIAEGVRRAQAGGCDIVVGIGGGSALDTAKAVALMLGNEGSIRDYVGIHQVPRKGAPVIAIPTTAGTGSEITIWSVLSDKANNVKLSVGSRYNCPDLALCDPELTLSLPPSVTAATGMDALVHALESYVNKATQPISEGMSLQAMRLIARSLRNAVLRGNDLDARYDMLLGSLLAAMAFNATRLGLAHALALPLGARFHIPHGLVNAILLPEVMDYNLPAHIGKFKEIALIFGVEAGVRSDREIAEAGVGAIRQLMRDIGIHQTLTDFGVTEEELPVIAEESLLSGNVAVNPRLARAADLMDICRRAMRQ